MSFLNQIEVFVPDSVDSQAALKRTTHMGIAAHHDDLEIMTYQGINECFASQNKWFYGVVVTDGANSPRDGAYENYSNEEMMKLRKLEQRKAAFVGEYSGVAFLDITSAEIKNKKEEKARNILKEMITLAKPKIIYTHNLADKHETHVAVSVRVIEALRELPAELHPEKLYGCEVWRGLDWMLDKDKAIFDVSERSNIGAALVEVFDSQICGGKRYDLATSGRRLANATYSESHNTDKASALSFAMDLTPLIKDKSLNIVDYITGYVDNFRKDVESKILKMI